MAERAEACQEAVQCIRHTDTEGIPDRQRARVRASAGNA